MSRRSRLDERGVRNFRRRANRRSSDRCILIVTEGEKTEVSYFENLARTLELGMTRVLVVHPDCTDPENLLAEAIRLRNDRKKEVARERKKSIPDSRPEYDEVWVVCDLEHASHEHRTQFKNAAPRAASEGIHFAESDPSFEFWLFLHYAYSTAPLSHQNEATRVLARHWLNYKKGEDPPEKGRTSSERWRTFFHERLEAAVERAARIRTHHSESKSDGNPSTRADELVRVLNEAASEAARILGPADD